jgi:hypothetical protein
MLWNNEGRLGTYEFILWDILLEDIYSFSLEKILESIEGHRMEIVYGPLLEIEWILVIHNNCIFL